MNQEKETEAMKNSTYTRKAFKAFSGAIKIIVGLSLVFASSFAYSQSKGVYVDVSADLNKAVGIFDNPRTEIDHRGLDADIEIGVTTNKVGAYIFYGAFYEAGYQNYGSGADYYFAKGEWFDFAAGAGVSVVLREIVTGVEYDQTAWGGFVGYHVRGTGVFWLKKNIGVSGRLQYQRRPDLSTGILEGAIGIRGKF